METKTQKPTPTKVVGGGTTREPSQTLTIKSLSKTVRNLIRLKMVTEAEANQLKSLNNTIVERWIGGSLNL